MKKSKLFELLYFGSVFLIYNIFIMAMFPEFALIFLLYVICILLGCAFFINEMEKEDFHDRRGKK